MSSIHSIHWHFSAIASGYRDLRRTDRAPILLIKKLLKGVPRPRLVDVGCGAGRYDLLLVRELGRRAALTLVDANAKMLREARRHLRGVGAGRLRFHVSRAHRLPLADRSFDAVLTFNAVHLFDLDRFLSEASRVLKPGGFLFIYTRTPAQNRSILWGRYFPEFAKREKRLHSVAALRRQIGRTPGLRYQFHKVFTFARSASLNGLLRQAARYHYSTLRFYPPVRFRWALRRFEENLRRHFKDPRAIRWRDRNVMVIARCEPNSYLPVRARIGFPTRPKPIRIQKSPRSRRTN